MVRKGKERATPADQHEAPETVADSRSLNGINRQLRADAPAHQLAASEAAATKRTSQAMGESERKRKRAARAVEARAAQKFERERQAAAAADDADAEAFAAALQRIVEAEEMDSAVAVDFEEWLRRKELCPDQETLEQWRTSDAYEQSRREAIVGQCTCFLEPDGGKLITSLPYEELKRRTDDDVTQQKGEAFQAWDERVRADRTSDPPRSHLPSHLPSHL